MASGVRTMIWPTAFHVSSLLAAMLNSPRVTVGTAGAAGAMGGNTGAVGFGARVAHAENRQTTSSAPVAASASPGLAFARHDPSPRMTSPPLLGAVWSGASQRIVKTRFDTSPSHVDW